MQVNKQAGAQLQHKWQVEQQAELNAKQAAVAAHEQQERNAQADLEKTARAAKVLDAKRAKDAEFARAFPTSQAAEPATKIPKPSLPTDVESGFLDTIIQRAGAKAARGVAQHAGMTPQAGDVVGAARQGTAAAATLPASPATAEGRNAAVAGLGTTASVPAAPS